MSRNYYTANEPFYMNESKVRQIVQGELQIFFSDIKQEIQLKIKQIDKNILEIKSDIRRIQQKPDNEPTLLIEKIAELNQKIEQIRKYKQSQIQKLTQQIRNRSIDRSYDRRLDRSPLFRKNNTAPTLDLNNIIFGDENAKLSVNTMPIANQMQPKIITNGKPPLPKVKSEPRMNQQKYERNYQPSYLTNNNENQQVQTYGVSNHYKNQQAKIVIDQKQQHFSSRIQQNLSKNKNSFMRKKSLKKIGVIPEQQMEQSMLSSNN